MPNRDSDSKEIEQIDGSLIASELIKRLPKESQERILNAISKSSPAIADKIQENLLSFADFLKDSPRIIQSLIRESSDSDLAIGLINVSDEIQTFFFDNMSARKQEAIKLEQLERSNTGDLTSQHVRAAQMRLLSQVREIRSRTNQNLPVKKEVWA